MASPGLVWSRRALDQAHQVGLPDTRGHAFACDIAENHAQSGAEFHDLEEIARQMANREDFASDFKFAPTHFAGSAELALDLGGLVRWPG